MPHQPKDYRRLVDECRGFLSEAQLTAHFELYQGYVTKLNEIEEGLRAADRESANYSYGEYSELRRREPVAYNGTVLHELYFENLGRGGEPPAAFRSAFAEAHGSWDDAIADVKAMASSAHGWVLVAHDGNFGGVRSHLVQSEHHVGLLPNQTILLAIDCWEHAYFADYRTKKAAYVDGLLKHVHWPAVAARWARCEALEREIAHVGA
jgi:Fe-Mn family superoxide dismutase